MELKLTDVTLLLFEVNAALDTGKHEGFPTAGVKQHIRAGDLVTYLQNELSSDVDLSFYKEETAAALVSELKDLEGGVNGRERKKFGVERNGLCLLIAYLTELIQRKFRPE